MEDRGQRYNRQTSLEGRRRELDLEGNDEVTCEHVIFTVSRDHTLVNTLGTKAGISEVQSLESVLLMCSWSLSKMVN